MILGEAKYYFENIAKKQPKHIFPYRLSYPFIFQGLHETVGFELLDCPMSVEKALDLLCETRRIESRWAWCSFNEKSEFVFSSGWRDVNNDQYTKEWINKINPNQGKEGTRSLFELAFGLKTVTFEYRDSPRLLLDASTGKPLDITYQVSFGDSEEEVHSFDFCYWSHYNPLAPLPTRKFTIFKGTAKEFEAELKRLKLPYEKTIG